MKYDKGIDIALNLYSPEKAGQCYQATRFLIEKYPELKEEIVQIKNNEGDIKHCIAIMPDGRIIDTQHIQFGLVLPISSKFENIFIFTRAEHEKYLPRFEYAEQGYKRPCC